MKRIGKLLTYFAIVLIALLAVSMAFAQKPGKKNTKSAKAMKAAAAKAAQAAQAAQAAEEAKQNAESTVVFIGDSITEFWNLPEYFPGRPFTNRGVNSQSTAHLLSRFQTDVIALKPKVVVIQGGINDIAIDSSAAGIEKTEKNLSAMAALAKNAGIKVVIASLMPVNDSKHSLTEGRPTGTIVGVNKWIKKFAGDNGFVFVDYYAALAGEDGLLPVDLSDDGIHPNARGYALMKPLLEKAIEQALTKKAK